MPPRIRFRSPGVKPGQKIGPLGPFRGRLGIHWVLGSLALGILLAVAGWLFFTGGAPGEPWRPVALLESLAPGSARTVGDGVAVGRLPGGQVVAVAEPTGCPLQAEEGGYRDCRSRAYELDGQPQDEGAPLDLVPVQVVRGTIYVDPGARVPR
jgi:hypothetical protein